MIEPRDILVSVIIPGVLSLLLLVIAWQPWRRKNPAAHGGWAMPLAAGLAVTFAYAALQRHLLIPSLDADATRVPLSTIPPTTVYAWLLFLSVPAGMVGMALALTRARWWAMWPVGLIVIGGYLRLLMPRQEWTTVAVVVVIAWGAWVLLEPLAARAKGIIVPLSLWLAASAAAAVLTDGGTQKTGLYAGALSTVAAAAAVVALVGKDNVSLARGGALVFMTLLAGLLVIGHFYNSVTVFQAIGVMAIPLMAWVSQIPRIVRMTALKRTAITMSVVLIATAIVAGPAVVNLIKLAMRASSGGDEYNYY